MKVVLLCKDVVLKVAINTNLLAKECFELRREECVNLHANECVELHTKEIID